MSPRWLFFPAAASGGSDWSDYMSANSGIGYWIVPDGTASTGPVSGPTGGDSSTNWTQIRYAGKAEGTTAGGVSISGVTNEWKRGPQGGHNQYSNSYNYLAVGWETAGLTSQYGQANTAGWIIAGREATAGGLQSGRQTFIPIEGTNGMTQTTYAGGSPTWNISGYGDHIVFFFNNYTSGDVQNWTAWDGSTTP